MENNMSRKTCSYCKKRKSIKKFRKNGEKVGNQCYECRAETVKKYYEKNKKEIQSWKQDHYIENEKYYKEKAKQWRDENAERKSEVNRIWYEENSGSVRERSKARSRTKKVRELNKIYGKRWRDKNKGKVKAKHARRRAAIRSAKIPKGLTPVDEEVIRRMMELANRRNDKAGYWQFDVDHIIPISRGGFHHQDNLRVTTRKNNRGIGGKHTKLDSEWGKVPYCHYRREYYTFELGRKSK
jgi:hypothetical protein